MRCISQEISERNPRKRELAHATNTEIIHDSAQILHHSTPVMRLRQEKGKRGNATRRLRILGFETQGCDKIWICDLIGKVYKAETSLLQRLTRSHPDKAPIRRQR